MLDFVIRNGGISAFTLRGRTFEADASPASEWRRTAVKINDMGTSEMKLFCDVLGAVTLSNAGAVRTAQGLGDLARDVANGYWAFFRDCEAAGEWLAERWLRAGTLKYMPSPSELNRKKLGETFLRPENIAEKHCGPSGIAVKFREPFDGFSC